ncbi:substrate-binding domain-containing protein [Lipingzhangella sp. LS1_29]|uniref:Substrate-binding domain-containing protein n=1 Tax=Lipingzhangella rawalii TaxID=2055835 RepID=A0ABU2H6Q7_9ACTN|nr:substrate-binding domain-containing protein [Lipingzhangella rawalii]MDS1270963.1 substrate-binding domain-containing protein [Lipingzhangella rawalii]
MARRDSSDTSSGAESRSARRRRSRPRRGNRGWAFLAFTSALVVLVGAGVTGWYVLRGAGACIAGTTQVEIASAPELSPALSELASRFHDGDPDADPHCVSVEIQERDPANVAYAITGMGPTTGDSDADVWIPDSSLWAELVIYGAGLDQIDNTDVSVATSPLVLASTGSAAEAIDATSWSGVTPTAPPDGSEPESPPVQVVDPVRSSQGLATLALVNNALEAEHGSDPTENEDEQPVASPELVAALQSMQASTAHDEEGAFAQLAGLPPEEADEADEANETDEAAADEEHANTDGAVIALSEQAVHRYNTEYPDHAAQVNYPEEGTFTLDYPYLLRTTDPEVTDAAETFLDYITTSDAEERIRARGFRSPDGTVDTTVLDDEAGFAEEMPESLPKPGGSTVATLTSTWNQLQLPSRVLTLMDVSGSMLSEVPGTDLTRMQAATASANDGLQMFPDNAELGTWEFSLDINDGLDYREAVPIRPLGTEVNGHTHREELARHLTELEPIPDGGTALYDTVFAAYQELQRDYSPNHISTILLLTDGDDTKDDGLSLDELTTALEEESGDEERPISIIIVSFGPDVDQEPMEEIADTLDGRAYATNDPTEIGDIFLEAFTLRTAEAAAEEH